MPTTRIQQTLKREEILGEGQLELIKLKVKGTDLQTAKSAAGILLSAELLFPQDCVLEATKNEANRQEHRATSKALNEE